MVNVYNLDNLEASFREFLLAGNFQSTSIRNYLSDFRHFTNWINYRTAKSQTIEKNDSIDANLIEKYRSYLIEDKLPVKTVNRRLSSVRKFCSFCISQGWMKENPAKRIKNVGPKFEIESILKQYEKDLKKEGVDQEMNKDDLAIIKEFLSITN